MDDVVINENTEDKYFDLSEDDHPEYLTDTTAASSEARIDIRHVNGKDDLFLCALTRTIKMMIFKTIFLQFNTQMWDGYWGKFSFISAFSTFWLIQVSFLRVVRL